MKIVITDYYYNHIEKEISILKKALPEVEIVDLTKVEPEGITDPKVLIPHVKDADGVITQFANIDEEVIKAMDKCKVISKYAVGLDTIDVKAADDRGIQVMNVPDYCMEEVASTAMAYLLIGMRKLYVTNMMLKKQSFAMHKISQCHRISESTLCILGFGNIARELYDKAKHFFGRIVVCDPYFKGRKDYPKVEFLDMEQAMAIADAISIHVPLNESTKHLVNEENLNLMKEGAIIVNTARGGIIDEEALYEAVINDKIGGVYLDVVDNEKYINNKLLHYSNVFISPHIGWMSEEAEQELQRRTAENVVKVLCA